MAVFDSWPLETRLVQSALAFLATPAAAALLAHPVTVLEQDRDEELTGKSTTPKPLCLIVTCEDEGRHGAQANLPIRSLRLALTLRGNAKTDAGEYESLHAAAALLERLLDDTNLQLALDSATHGVRVMLALRRPGTGRQREGLLRRQRYELEVKAVAAERCTA